MPDSEALPHAVPVLPGVQLAQRLVEDNADGGGQVETADCAAWHRNAQRPARVPRQHLRGQPSRLRSEQQTVAWLILHRRVRQFATRADTEEPAAPGVVLFELGKRIVLVNLNRVPVIEPRPAHRALVGAEPQPAYEVQ